MRNVGLDETQSGIKIAGRNINNLRNADEMTLWQKQRVPEKHLISGLLTMPKPLAV